jgi:short-subunit dehydrogenase
MSNESSVQVCGDFNSKNKNRKALRQAVFSGIVRRHRKTLFVLGSFLGLYHQDQANTYGASK